MNIPCKFISLLGLAAICAGIDVSLRPPQLEVKAPLTQPVTQPVAPPVKPVNPTPAPTQPANSTTTPPVTQAPADETLGLELSLAQAKKLFDDGTTFIDARLEHEYAEGHIRFAVHLDSNELGSPQATAVLAKTIPSQRLVIYCGGGDCHASHNLAIYLQQAGYTDLHIFKDGFPAWKAAGYEITTGANP